MVCIALWGREDIIHYYWVSVLVLTMLYYLGLETGCLHSTGQQGEHDGGHEDPGDLAGEGGEVGDQALTEDLDEETRQDCVLDQVQINHNNLEESFDQTRPVDVGLVCS